MKTSAQTKVKSQRPIGHIDTFCDFYRALTNIFRKPTDKNTRDTDKDAHK